jgi:hypothetical protein
MRFCGGHTNGFGAARGKTATFIIRRRLAGIYSCAAGSDSSRVAGVSLTLNDDVWVVWPLHLGRAAAAAAAAATF